MKIEINNNNIPKSINIQREIIVRLSLSCSLWPLKNHRKSKILI